MESRRDRRREHFFCSLEKVNYFSLVNIINSEDKYVVAACRDAFRASVS